MSDREGTSWALATKVKRTGSVSMSRFQEGMGTRDYYGSGQ